MCPSQIYFFSDNDNLVSFKRAIFVDYSLVYKKYVPIVNVNFANLKYVHKTA